jgi:hypothetical protein
MINLLLRASTDTVYTIVGSMPATRCDISTVHPYNSISQLFDFQIGDLVIVLSASDALDLRNITRISSASTLLTIASSVPVQRVFIFTEDLYTFKNDTAEEIIFLKKLIDYMKYSWYRIYHCERDVSKLNTLGLNIQYFDWYVCSSIEYYTSVLPPPTFDFKFEKRLCCLNRRFGEHRYLASAVLSNQPNVHVSQQYSLEDTSMNVINIDTMSDPIKSLVTQGLKNLKNRTSLIDRSMPVENVDFLDYTSNDAVLELNNITRNSFCSIITESRYHTEYPNFSEKTLRVLYSGRPFLLLAPKGTLKLLHQLGFKTFSQHWDESYDTIEDPTIRFQRVMTLALDILSKKNLNLAPFKFVLEHNQRQIIKSRNRMYNLL